jgi:dipeptidyl-peptidase-4
MSSTAIRRRSPLPLAVLITLLLAPLARAQTFPLTLDDVVAGVRLSGTPPASPTWSPDGSTLAFLWDSAARPAREVWLVGRDGANRRALPMPDARGSAAALAWTRDGTALLVLRGGDLWRVTPRAGAVARLTRDLGAEQFALSPDGATIAVLREGDLWTVPSAGGTPRRLTQLAVAGPSTAGLGTYARRDREIGDATWGTGTPLMAWAPDSRTLAIHVVDRRALRTVPFPHYLADDTQPNALRRPYPGDVNEMRTVALVDATTGAMTEVPLADGTSMQVLNLAWSPQGTLLVDRASDDNTRREVHVVSRDGTPSPAWRDARATRIYTEFASTWSADGRTLLLSADLEDRYRIYRVTPGDTTPVPLTPADADVQGAAMPLASGDVLYVAGAPTPAERHAFRVTRRGRIERLTRRAGTHAVVPSPDGRTLATIASTDTTPPELWLVPTTGGTEVRVTRAGTPRLTAAGLVAPQYLRIPGADAGDTLAIKAWLPPAARSGRVPVLFGPLYSNTVRNRWGGTYGLLQQLLVQRGYAVVQVDVRGSTGYGRAWREKFLCEWGGRDLDDLAATKRWLGGQPWADTSRTGVFGSSYGGLVGVYAMLTRPGLFTAAVAGAPATDPRFFGSDDVAITRTPAERPDCFARGAAQHAAELAGHLMIIHGLMDDVVPFKTTADLAEALMRAGKDFDLVIAPGATHGWTARPHHARYLLGKLVEHFARWVPVGG